MKVSVARPAYHRCWRGSHGVISASDVISDVSCSDGCVTVYAGVVAGTDAVISRPSDGDTCGAVLTKPSVCTAAVTAGAVAADDARCAGAGDCCVGSGRCRRGAMLCYWRLAVSTGVSWSTSARTCLLLHAHTCTQQ